MHCHALLPPNPSSFLQLYMFHPQLAVVNKLVNSELVSDVIMACVVDRGLYIQNEIQNSVIQTKTELKC